jgi:superfamily II DNA or RNA helicase
MRRKLRDKCSYFDQRARHTMSFKLGRWDGKITFFQISGASYLNMLDLLYPIVSEKYDIDIKDNREQYNFKFDTINERYWADKGYVWPKGHKFEGQEVLLQDYQYNSVNEFLKDTQTVKQLSTGAGKTLLTATLSHMIEPYGRTVVIVPSKSLVMQTEEQYSELSLDVGVYYGDKKETNKIHTITTWQSLEALRKKDKEDKTNIFDNITNDVSCVIVDECLSEDTLINTKNGNVIIKDINIGDEVLSFNEITREYEYKPVINTYKNMFISSKEDMYEITIGNNTIHITGNHKVLLKNRTWKMAKELSVGDDLIDVFFNKYKPRKLKKLQENEQKITSIKKIQKPENVYNLHIKDNHNYVANNVLVSNCHGAKAASLKSILTDEFSNVPIRIGITGTVPKEEFDKRSLIVSIGPIAEEKVGAKELQERGILSKCHVNILQTVETREFDTYHAENDFLISDKKRLEFIADKIFEMSKNGNTLVLMDKIKTGDILQDILCKKILEDKGFDDVYIKLADLHEHVPFIRGDMSVKNRKVEYDSVAEEDNRILLASYGVASTGVNIPRIFNLILIESGKSFVKVIQSIGRGLRVAKDKDHVEIWDITSTCKFSKKHLTKRKEYYKEAEYPFSITKVKY